MLTIPLDGLIATAHIFQGLKLQIIYWATLLELPVVIVKNKSLAVYLIGCFLEHFNTKYVFSKATNQDPS